MAKTATTDAATAVAWLKAHGNPAFKAGLARYGLPTDKAFGLSVATIKSYAKTLGRDHDLAVALWKTGWTDARMLAALVGEPDQGDAGRNGCLVPRLRQLGHRRHRVLHALGPVAARVDEGEAVGEAEARVREARRLRADGLPRRARQEGDGRGLSAVPAAHREGRERRAELREEGRELGAAPHRSSQREASRRRDQDRDAAVEVDRRDRAMGGEGRAEGSDAPGWS